MSLINKMLQDLDARGSTGAATLQLDIKPVARAERHLSLPLALGLLAGVIGLAVAAIIGWRFLHKPPASAALASRPAVVVMRPAPKVVPAAQPVAAPVSAGHAPAAPVQHQTEQDDVGREGGARPKAAVPTPAAEGPTKARVPAPTGQAGMAQSPSAAQPASALAPPRNLAAPQNHARIEPNAGAKDAPAPAARAPGTGAAPAKPAAPEGSQGHSGRRGEDAYRRALASLQEGRVTETIATLEQALQHEPRHDAARQTLIGLLVESGRVDEAMRQLQQALAFDARQPALAMLLARLQIERGGSGIETLTRTLPYAGGNAEYQAFLAGALQRQGRHTEAAEQYQAALRSAPGNGIWWMGLGISLQADKRDADARAAYRRAQAAATLTPELQAFVERKLQQLAR
jgi:MSHA biogenesis protein MshN